jgi:hypothetical protein
VHAEGQSGVGMMGCSSGTRCSRCHPGPAGQVGVGPEAPTGPEMGRQRYVQMDAGKPTHNARGEVTPVLLVLVLQQSEWPYSGNRLSELGANSPVPAGSRHPGRWNRAMGGGQSHLPTGLERRCGPEVAWLGTVSPPPCGVPGSTASVTMLAGTPVCWGAHGCQALGRHGASGAPRGGGERHQDWGGAGSSPRKSYPDEYEW